MKTNSHYDIAQICMNGHVINSASQKYPERNSQFCPMCGEKTIFLCSNCQSKIHGSYTSSSGWTCSITKPSAYCHSCGKPYPWTENKIMTAVQIFAEFGNLDDNEKETLEQDLNNIAKDVPQAELSAMRIKKIWNKCGNIAYGVIMEFASKTAAECLKSP